MLAVLFFLASDISAQNGYIYVHKKTINENASLDFPFTLKNGSGTTINSFTLSDKPDNYYNVYDIGAGHGNGAGELWAIAGTGNNTLTTGTVYRRQAGGSTWAAAAGVNTSNGNPSAIDGAYLNQFVYISGGRVYFYNGGTSTLIYNTNNAIDVSAANGQVVIATSANTILKWSGTYTTSTVSTSTTWTTVTLTGTSGTIQRVDMNAAGTSIAYITNTGGATVYTVPYAGGAVTNLGLSNNTARPGSTTGPGNFDVAWGDNGTIYAIAASNVNVNAGSSSDIVYSYSGGSWTAELEARSIARITAGPADQAWGVALEGAGFAQSIWTRTMDGTHLWMDDERVKNNSSLYGNATMIEVPAGTYTLAETIGNVNWDLGRFNVYDPTGNTTTSNSSTSASINVSAGEVVHIEFINELLIPKSIQLNCSNQYLQSFDAGTGSNQFGTGTFGTYVEGTSYHYYTATSPQDGYYSLIRSVNGNWFNSQTPDLVDHTSGRSDRGYFMLVNATYGKDEFYRQRITNLVPGIQYSISFWAADLSGSNPIRPDISFGMQDLNGNIYGNSTSGPIYPTTAGTNTAVWRNYYFVFTQPAGITTADLFIRNNYIGGWGNDLAIDDITLNPVLQMSTENVVPPVLCTAPYPYNYRITNPSVGGFWSSSNPTVASVNAVTGDLTSGSTPGSAIITYYLTNSLGCITQATSNIVVYGSPTVSAAANTSSACVGQVVNLTSAASGGTGPYTYSWLGDSGSGLSTSSNANETVYPLTAGTHNYNITVTDSKGCKAADTTLVITGTGAAPLVSVAASASTSGNICAGATAVNLSATPSPAGSYTYSWTGSGINDTTLQSPTAYPTQTGSFTVNIINSQGCYANATTNAVTVWPKPTVNPSSNFTQACRSQTVNLFANKSGGTSTFTYAWSNTSSSGTTNTINTATSENPTVTYPTGANGTYTYTLTLTDSKGCTATGSTQVVISNNTTIPTATLAVSPATVCIGSPVTLTATRNNTNGTYTYTWAGDGVASTTTTSTGRPVTNTATPTTASSSSAYSVIITNSSGCSAAATANVLVRSLPDISLSSNVSNGCVNATVTLTANVTTTTLANYTYAWTGTGLSSTTTSATSSTTVTKTATIASAGTYSYTVSVTDGNGCKSVVDAASTVPVTIGTSPTISNIAVSNSTPCSNQSITLTPTVSSGTTPYSYFWTGSTGAGLVDDNTAVATAYPTVNANYSLFVIDNNGCTATGQTSTIVVKAAPAIIASVNNATVCSGQQTISLGSTPSGGSGTYSSFSWVASAGATGGLGTSTTQNTTATPTASGNYTVRVTDANGCTASDAVAVVVNPIPNVTGTNTAQTVCSGSGLTTITFSGTVTGTTYNWTRNNGDATTGNVTGIGASGSGNISGTLTNTTVSAKTVTFTVTPSASGCTGTPITATAVVNPNFAVALSGTQSFCGAPTSASLTLTSAGPYPFNATLSNGSTYTISGATTTVNVTPTATTTYTVSSLSSSSCASGGGISGSAVVTIKPMPTVTATNASQTICSGNAISSISLSGSVSGTTYSWTRDNGDVTTGNVTGITASGNGNISGTLTNTTSSAKTVIFTVTPSANGCTGTAITPSVVVNPNFAVALSGTQSFCGAPASAQLTLASAGPYPFDVTLSNGSTYTVSSSSMTVDVAPTATTTYTVSSLSPTSCASGGGVSGSAVVTINPIPTVTANTSSQTVCSGTAINTIVLSGSVSGTTLNWTRNGGNLTTGNVRGIATSGSGNIAGTLTNVTTTARTVTFTVTPTANGCTGTAITSRVVVNPNISVALSGSQSYCTSAGSAPITLTSAGAFPFNVSLSDGSTYTMTSSPMTVNVSPSANTTYTIASLSVTNNCASGGGFSGVAVITLPTTIAPIGTWICGTDNDWFNPCNWGGGVVPTNSIDVIIPAAVACSPVIDPTSSKAPVDKIARSKSITISKGLSFANGGDLYVAGNWNNTVGTVGFTANTGTVTIMGTAPQTITTVTGYTEAFYNLTIFNTSKSAPLVTLNNPATVSGVLNLTQGVVKTESTKLLSVLNTSVNAVMGGAEDAFVWGPLARNTNSAADYYYPVGNPNGPYGVYRPATVVPASATASTYQVEYKITTPVESLDNRGGSLAGILTTEHWQVDRTAGNADAVIKLPYINPDKNTHWTDDLSPCSSCNVAVVTPFAVYSDYWYFTNGTTSTGGFATDESRYYASSGSVSSKLMSAFGDFTFGYAYSMILPVKLLAFNGQVVNGDGKLTWTINDAKDLNGFELEYSEDGRRFSKLASIPANTAATAYAYIHTAMHPGQNYYRLLVKDKNGNSFYSKAVLLTSDKNITVIRGLRPTLANSQTTMFIHSAIPQIVNATLVDATGRTIAQYKTSLVAGENNYPINTMMLARGVYNLYVQTGDGAIANLRFVKE